MKKILALLIIFIAALGLTACDWGIANEDHNNHIMVDHIEFISAVYCTKNSACEGCTSWADRKDISSASSVSCTYIDSSYGSYHMHYCVTWIKDKD